MRVDFNLEARVDGRVETAMHKARQAPQALVALHSRSTARLVWLLQV